MDEGFWCSVIVGPGSSFQPDDASCKTSPLEELQEYHHPGPKAGGKVIVSEFFKADLAYCFSSTTSLRGSGPRPKGDWTCTLTMSGCGPPGS